MVEENNKLADQHMKTEEGEIVEETKKFELESDDPNTSETGGKNSVEEKLKLPVQQILDDVKTNIELKSQIERDRASQIENEAKPNELQETESNMVEIDYKQGKAAVAGQGNQNGEEHGLIKKDTLWNTTDGQFNIDKQPQGEGKVDPMLQTTFSLGAQQQEKQFSDVNTSVADPANQTTGFKENFLLGMKTMPAKKYAEMSRPNKIGIELEYSQISIFPGTAVMGRVLLDLYSDVKADALNISLLGEEIVKFNTCDLIEESGLNLSKNEDAGYVKLYSQAEAYEKMIDIKHKLKKLDDEDNVMKKGQYECHFEIEIPNWLPESNFMKIQHQNEVESIPGFACCRYTLKAELGDSLDYSTVIIIVHSNRSLNDLYNRRNFSSSVTSDSKYGQSRGGSNDRSGFNHSSFGGGTANSGFKRREERDEVEEAKAHIRKANLTSEQMRNNTIQKSQGFTGDNPLSQAEMVMLGYSLDASGAMALEKRYFVVGEQIKASVEIKNTNSAIPITEIRTELLRRLVLIGEDTKSEESKKKVNQQVMNHNEQKLTCFPRSTIKKTFELEIPTIEELQYEYPVKTEQGQWIVHPHEEYLETSLTPSFYGKNYQVIYEIIVSCKHENQTEFRRLCQHEIYVHPMPQMSLFNQEIMVAGEKPPTKAITDFGEPENGYPKPLFMKFKCQSLGHRMLPLPTNMYMRYHDKIIAPHRIKIDEMILYQQEQRALNSHHSKGKKKKHGRESNDVSLERKDH